MLSYVENISFDEIKYGNDTSVLVARLDKIHPEVSGNKLFKLHYFMEECLGRSHKTMLTFGGAYSNHLAATAFLCREKGVKAIGIMRGEEPPKLSHTLERCRALGMQLHFISRDQYRQIQDPGFLQHLKNIYGDCTIVPEGGFGPKGANGASLIMDLMKEQSPTHICTAVGTATTVAGLLMKKDHTQVIIAVPVIKNMTDIEERVRLLTGGTKLHPTVFPDHHFGGYAKFTPPLIQFMNDFFAQYKIPLDFVYTAKMMHAVTDKLKQGYFKKGSRIICLHTGGLQGNESLPAGTLIF